MNTNTTAAQSRILARFTALRQQAWGVQGAVGQRAALDFARNAARGWCDDGFAGIASACWALSADLANVPGAYDVFAEARALGFAAQGVLQ